MLKRLRLQFAAVIMVIVTIMLCTVFGMLYFFTRSSLEQESFAMMRAVPVGIMAPDRPLAPFARPGEQPEQVRLPFFVVQEAEDGTLTAAGVGYYDLSPGEAFDQTFLQELIQEVERVNRPSGELKQYHLRFLRVDAPFGQSVIFADTTSEQSTLNNLVKNCILIGVLCFFAFLGISIKLAAWTVKPVEWAWQQQRQFVADASHELKTPLTVILANTGLVLSHPEDTVAAQSKWLEYTHDEAEQMKELVDDLLFLAKSDAARQPAARAETAMSEVALGCLLPFESVAFEAGVALEHRITPGLSLRGDEGQLRRLVMILLDNAVKYAGPGGTVTFTLERHQERLRLAVHNTGEPIPPEHLPHLFERFYRADAARNRSGGGYGLGLAIARSIVEGHHGRLTVTSTAAAGTTFPALLPRR